VQEKTDSYAEKFSTTKTKVDPMDFKKDMNKEFRLENNISSYARGGPTLSRFQVHRLEQKILPEVEENPTITNARRELALGEPYNAIANAVIATAIMQPDENKKVRFPPECLANMDAMSVVLGVPKKNQKVLMPKGSKEAMKKLGRSCSRQSKQGHGKKGV
jgi:hypothetical protein